MASTTASVTVAIGAVLAGSFSEAFGKATTGLNKIGSAIEGLRSKTATLDSLRQAQDKAGTVVDSLSAKFARQQVAAQRDADKLAGVRAQVAAAGTPTDKLAGLLARTENQALRSANALTVTGSQLQKAREGFAAASDKANQFAASNGMLGASFDKVNSALRTTEAAYARYQQAQAAVQAADKRRAEYRAKLVEVVAAGAGIKKLIEKAAEREEAILNLKWVLRAEDKDKAIAQVVAQTKEFSRNSLATVPELLQIQAVLNRQGFDAQVARLASESAHKVAAITHQDAGATAAVIASIYNQSARTMSGTADEKFRHISDLVTQLQHQFNITDVGGLGSGLARLLPIASALRIPLGQVGSAIGVLTRNGFDASTAGQGLRIVLNRMEDASAKLHFGLARDAKNNLDFNSSLRQMNAAIVRTYGSMDAGSEALSKVFSSRGAAMILTLSRQTRQIHEEQKRMAEEMPGIVEREYAELTNSARGMLVQLKKNFDNFLRPIGTALLPGFKAILQPLAAASASVGGFLEKHKTMAKVLGTAAAAALSFAAATFLIGYASSIASGGWARGVLMLRRLQVELVAARTGFLGLAAAEAAEGEAAAAKNVGAVGRYLGGLANAGGGAVTRTVRGIGSGIIALFTPSFWGRVFGGAAGAASNIGSGVMRSIVGIGPAVAGVVSSIGGSLSRLSFSGIWQGLLRVGSIARGIIPLIASVFAAPATPLIVGIAALAAAGALVYKYWQPIKAFFQGLWEGVQQGLAPVGQAFKEAFAPLKPVWDELKGFFSWLFQSSDSTGQGLKAAFASGIWWGQKIGAVLGFTFTTVFRVIGTVIQSVITLGKLLRDIATGNWSRLGEDIKEWGSYVAESGRAIGKSFQNILKAPDYTAADAAARRYQADAARVLAQKQESADKAGEALEDARQKLADTKKEIAATGDPTGKLADQLDRLQRATENAQREFNRAQEDLRRAHDKNVRVQQVASSPADKPKVFHPRVAVDVGGLLTHKPPQQPAIRIIEIPKPQSTPAHGSGIPAATHPTSPRMTVDLVLDRVSPDRNPQPAAGGTPTKRGLVESRPTPAEITSIRDPFFHSTVQPPLPIAAAPPASVVVNPPKKNDTGRDLLPGPVTHYDQPAAVPEKEKGGKGGPHASKPKSAPVGKPKRMFAVGGLITREVNNATIGEAGKEVVIPLERPSTLALIGDSIASAMRRIGNIRSVFDSRHTAESSVERTSRTVERTVSIESGRNFRSERERVVSVDRIPKLATGGIVTKPTIAMIGEAGKEAVVPLSRPAAVATIFATLAAAAVPGPPQSRAPQSLSVSAPVRREPSRLTQVLETASSERITSTVERGRGGPVTRHYQVSAPVTVNIPPGINDPKAFMREIQDNFEAMLVRAIESSEAQARAANHD